MTPEQKTPPTASGSPPAASTISPSGGEPSVAALGKEVVETRNQMIKTANMLGNLTGEVRELARMHQQHRRGLTLHSMSAYVLFVILVSATSYFTYRAKVERLDFERDTVVRAHAATRNKLEKLRREIEKRREAEVQAAAFYRLSKSSNVQKALDQYADVAQLPLSRVEAAVFQDWVNKTRSRLAYTAYANGMKAVGEMHWKRAATEFQRSIQYLPSPPHEASLRYYLGIALMKLGDYKEAAEELERSLSAGAEKLISHEVRYYLGTIYEQLGRRDKAKSAYSAYIKRFPSTSYARTARRRLDGLM